jgi:Kef-type K+ transport system membrane component KefB
MSRDVHWAQMVAASRSDETFVALCLLTVTGASLLTQRLGFSDTMGAFAAGVLLSETNFRSQARITSAVGRATAGSEHSAIV